MKVLIKEPGQDPRRADIENTLESLQSVVKGYIEAHKLVDGLVLLINEEGKLHNMEENFYMAGDMILGPALFVGENEDEFTDIRESDAIVLETFFSLEPSVREAMKNERIQ